MRVSRIAALSWIAGAAVLAALAACHRGSPPSTANREPADPKERLAMVSGGLRALESAERTASRSRWDPDYVAMHLGKDPREILSWVRTRTGWIPYHGVLRGPMGVLMDRQGNSLDRSLLLATLLEKKGFTVRLAHGELSATQAAALLPDLVAARDSLRIRDAGTAAAAQPDDLHPMVEASSAAAAARYGLDANTLRQRMQAHLQIASGMISELDARVRDESARLRHAVPPAAPGAEWEERYRAALSALEDHWWVQLQEGATWVDLDVTGSDEAGHAQAAARETMAAAALPATLHQEVVLRVIGEESRPGALKERTALEYTIHPSEIIGQPVIIQFWPVDWMRQDVPGDPKGDWRHDFEEVSAWGAGLRVGSEVVATGELDATGSEASSGAGARGGPMGGFAGAFTDSMGSTDHGRAADSGSALSAVWLEFELHVPGQSPRILRREVFDLLGPAARAASQSLTLPLSAERRLARSLAMLMQTDIVAQPCELAPQFVSRLVGDTLRSHREALQSEARGPVPASAGVPTQNPATPVTSGAWPLSSLYALALARFQFNPARASLYLDQPTILSGHHYLQPAGDGKGAVFRDATDIVNNEVAVSLSALDGFGARLTQGVLDTNAEAILQGQRPRQGNAGDAYANRGNWLAFQPGAGLPTLDQVQLSADARRRVALELAAGRAVVIPQNPITQDGMAFSGWWRVDPTSGHALGFNENGWGTSMVEEAPPVSRAAIIKQYYVAYLRQSFFATMASTYGWCMAFSAATHAGLQVYQGMTSGVWEVGPVTLMLRQSNVSCGATAIATGLLAGATIPLLAYWANASRHVARLGSVASAAQKGTGALEGAGTSAAEGTAATKGGTKPLPRVQAAKPGVGQPPAAGPEPAVPGEPAGNPQTPPGANKPPASQGCGEGAAAGESAGQSNASQTLSDIKAIDEEGSTGQWDMQVSPRPPPGFSAANMTKEEAIASLQRAEQNLLSAEADEAKAAADFKKAMRDLMDYRQQHPRWKWDEQGHHYAIDPVSQQRIPNPSSGWEQEVDEALENEVRSAMNQRDAATGRIQQWTPVKIQSFNRLVELDRIERACKRAAQRQAAAEASSPAVPGQQSSAQSPANASPALAAPQGAADAPPSSPVRIAPDPPRVRIGSEQGNENITSEQEAVIGAEAIGGGGS